ncbi:MAG: hypothetical protein ACI4Q3_09955 [Kiritimatiellia bacterium]
MMKPPFQLPLCRLFASLAPALAGWTPCLAASLPAPAIETPPVSVDEIRWKRFAPASEVYIDTTLQFTPTVGAVQNVDPKKDKLALWLDVDSPGGAESASPDFRPAVTSLCVYASLADLAPAPVLRTGGLRLGARGAVTVTKPRIFRLKGTSDIVPGRWYRLTVRTIKDVSRRAARTGDPARGLLGFQIYLDGALLRAEEPSFTGVYTAFAAGTEGWLDRVGDGDLLAFLRSGTVFVSLCGESADDAIASVGFRGEGELEDVAVSSEAPAFLGVTSLDFTLDFAPAESPVAALLSAEEP